MCTSNRKGAIVVLVAVLMVVLLGFGAFAVDLSQMQAYKSELRRAADAAVLAATLQLLHETQHGSAYDQAQNYVSKNPVLGGNATITSFQYGRYDDINKFMPLCTSGCSGIASAIRLSVTGPQRNFYLAQFLNRRQPFSFSAEAVAWLPITATPCAAPWAILDSNWPFALPSSGQPTETWLRNNPQVLIVKRLDRGSPPDPPDSWYGVVNLPPFGSSVTGDGVDNYAQNVALQMPAMPVGFQCHQLVYGDFLQGKIPGYNTETIDGTNVGGGVVSLCARLLASTCYGLGGHIGRAVRIPIVRAVPTGTCTTTMTFPEDRLSSGGFLCYEVLDVGTFVVVSASQATTEVGEVRAVYAGRDTDGPARGYRQRPILVQ